jgi:hypothetical protein
MQIFFIALFLSLAYMKCVQIYYTYLVDNLQGPGLPLMPVMKTRRGDRVHLSKQIDLMSNIQANGFVAPAFDLHNTGTNDVGGDSDDVSNLAVVGAGAAGAAESKHEYDGIAGEPQLEPHAMGPVEGEGGVKGNKAS